MNDPIKWKCTCGHYNQTLTPPIFRCMGCGKEQSVGFVLGQQPSHVKF